jgi:hypothetical protein
LDVSFPSPFKEMLSLLSFFSFDFLSLECIFEDSNHFTSVYLWSLTPIALALLLVAAHAVSSRFPGSTATRAVLVNRLLLLGYLVLPSVSLKQLQALDCVEVAGQRYLRIDTSVDCDSQEFKAFHVVDSLLITAYLSTPLLWLVLLFSHRESLNPPSTTGSDRRLAVFLRDQDHNVVLLRFLFDSYRTDYFFMEVIEM